jgi:cyclopropane fatty-acyl-phospholipid synthase-like methyltransferase
MSTNNSKNVALSDPIVQFYKDKLDEFGASAKGVGWKDREAQFTRFEQLCKVISTTQNFSVNDLGCGTAAMFSFFKNRYSDFRYFGYDILEEMISVAKKMEENAEATLLKTITEASEMEEADYSVASGIFNVRYSFSNKKWLEYIKHTVTVLNNKSVKGFAFNALSKYSDLEFMQDYLYYCDPLLLFDFCKKNSSKNVALLHDYNQYDFTIIVRK